VTLSDISIKRPVFAWMLMAALLVFGGIAFSRLGVSQMPDVDFPQVTIGVAMEGASPNVMETDVVDVIEDAVMSVEGVREINSTCRHGSASITIEFDLNRDIDAAVQDVQAKLAQAQRLLPKDMDPPILSKQNPEDNPILWIALSGHMDSKDLALYGRDHVKDRFQTVPGVGEVMMGGYLDRNVRIWLQPEELEARGLTVDDVTRALQREHIEVPAGRLETSHSEMNVRALGEVASVREFSKIVIAQRNGAPVLLSHVARIQDGQADLRRMARANGVPAIGMGIKKQRGANAVEVSRAVKARLEEIRKTLPPGMELSVNFDGTKYVEDSIHEMQFTLVLSIVLTSLVCWLFLGSWSSTFNVLLAIPTSIVGAFLLIWIFGFTLNTFTMLGLSLAIGIVVDDAIMVLENIVRHREKGRTKVIAASRGAREITGAAIATTLAIVAIFLPIAFMRGIIGKFLYQFGVTISVAVALSLLEALTLTPMRCSQMLAVGGRTGLSGFLERLFRGLGGAYRRVLAPCLRGRAVVLVVAILGFGASLFLSRKLNQEVVPPQDQGVFLVRLQTPVGSSLEYTDGKLRQCETFLDSRSEVARYFTIVGGFGGGEVDTGMMFVTLKPLADRKTSQFAFMDAVRGRFNSIPGLRAFVMDLSLRGLTGRGSQFPVEFTVTGTDWDELAGSSQKIMEKMRESGLMTDVNSNYLVGMPEAKVRPLRSRASDLGIDQQSIGTTIGALVGGVRVAKFEEGGHRFDVRVRASAESRSRPQDVERLFVRNRAGKLVRLSEVVEVSVEPTLQTITRRNRARAITVTAGVPSGVSQKIAMERVQSIAQSTSTSGTHLEFVGSSKVFQEGGTGIVFAILLGIVIAYMVLASQFNSFVHPGLVLLAMPFSVSGAIVAMWIAGVSFNMYSMIGFVLLMGIVKKNSILLVEFTNQVRARGLGVMPALLEACPIRLRPILMTSVSTIAAALPPALSLGPGMETMRAMAVVVIGGVAVSTILTLFVVPAAYALLPGRVKEIKLDEEPAVAEVVEKE